MKKRYKYKLSSRDNYIYKHPDTLDVLLQAMQKELESENDRIKIIDQRSISLLALAGVGLVTLTKFLDYKTYFKVPILGTSLIISNVLLALCLLLSICAFMNVLRLRDYSNPNEQQLVDENTINKSKFIVQDIILQSYGKVISVNRGVTNSKATSFFFGLISLFIFFILLVLQFILIIPYLTVY